MGITLLDTGSSSISVNSVAIHSGRGVCRDGLRFSRWQGLLPDENVLPRKYRMNPTIPGSFRMAGLLNRDRPTGPRNLRGLGYSLHPH